MQCHIRWLLGFVTRQHSTLVCTHFHFTPGFSRPDPVVCGSPFISKSCTAFRHWFLRNFMWLYSSSTISIWEVHVSRFPWISFWSFAILSTFVLVFIFWQPFDWGCYMIFRALCLNRISTKAVWIWLVRYQYFCRYGDHKWKPTVRKGHPIDPLYINSIVVLVIVVEYSTYWHWLLDNFYFYKFWESKLNHHR